VTQGRAAPTIGEVLQEALERDERRKQVRSGERVEALAELRAYWRHHRCQLLSSGQPRQRALTTAALTGRQ
jgi:hypothetical protein